MVCQKTLWLIRLSLLKRQRIDNLYEEFGSKGGQEYGIVAKGRCTVKTFYFLLFFKKVFI